MSEDSLGFWCLQRQPNLMSIAHAHSDLEWNYLLEGDLEYQFAGQRVLIPSSRFTIFWAGMPHRSIARSTNARYFVGVLSLSTILQWELSPAQRERLLAGEVLMAEHDEHGDDRRMLERWTADLASDQIDRHRTVGFELRARLMRLLSTGGATSLKGQAPPQLLGQLLQCLMSQASDGIGIAEAAAAVGCHPKYAASLFKKHMGQTPAAFLRRYRVAQAQRLLLEDQLTIAAIASSVGFNTSLNLNRAFHKELGQTPTQWRRQITD